MSKTLSVILTLYNKAFEVRSTVSALRDALLRENIDFEIILCDDGSIDETRVVSEQTADSFPEVRAIGYPENRGRGYAVCFALPHCQGKKIMYMDSDVPRMTDLAGIARAVEMLEQAGAVIGDRFHPSVQSRRNPIRYCVGHAYRVLKSVFFPELGLSDCEVGFKGFQASVLREYAPRCFEKRWSFDLELLWVLHRNGVTIREIPLPWNERQPGYHSSVRLVKDSIDQLLGFVRIRWKHRQRRSGALREEH